jgi:glycosyltransferase involved in cell wall biosynthesis
MDASDSPARLAVVIAAHDEADRIGATVAAVRDAFPGALVVVADDGSSDGTAAVAQAAGAQVARLERRVGKGGAASRGAALALEGDPELILLCDADLAASAARLQPLLDAVAAGDADLAVAVFARRVGGGFGVAVGFAHWAIRNLVGLDLQAPISGQRAMRADVLRAVTPFAPRFGMEIGMTVDAVRAGYRVGEVEVDLEHRATGRTWRGFVHRFRQLRDFVAVWAARRARG